MGTNGVRPLVSELIGTGALVFVGAGAGALGSGGLLGVALAHGLIVLGLIHTFGHVSGAQINPAVTLGIWAAGKMETRQALGFMVAQLLGGVLGALLLRFVLGGTATGLGATVLAESLPVGDAVITVGPAMGLVIEAVLTFFLVLSVLSCAVGGKAGSLAGTAIAATLVGLILAGAPLTGASFNPARTLGPAVALGEYPDLWLYFVGPLFGGAAAALVYRGLLEDRV